MWIDKYLRLFRSIPGRTATDLKSSRHYIPTPAVLFQFSLKA